MTTPTIDTAPATETLTSEQIDALLAADPDFAAVCDERHAAYLAAVELEDAQGGDDYLAGLFADDEGSALAAGFDVSDSQRFLP